MNFTSRPIRGTIHDKALVHERSAEESAEDQLTSSIDVRVSIAAGKIRR